MKAKANLLLPAPHPLFLPCLSDQSRTNVRATTHLCDSPKYARMQHLFPAIVAPPFLPGHLPAVTASVTTVMI